MGNVGRMSGRAECGPLDLLIRIPFMLTTGTGYLAMLLRQCVRKKCLDTASSGELPSSIDRYVRNLVSSLAGGIPRPL